MGNKILDCLNVIALILLAIGTVIQLLDSLGFLPQKARNFFKLNRSRDTIDVLKEFGVDTELYQKRNVLVGIPRDYPKEKLEIVTRKNLGKLKIGFNVSVGKVRKTELSYYIDLMGHSCDPIYAVAYARLLSSYWADCIEAINLVKNPQVDFIVTPKLGSPILGYEFAKLLKLPFILHEEEERFDCETNDMRKKFDCAEVPKTGSRALIVDDSTTGGRMVLETIQDLRKYHYEVTECLVVFEPQQKDARKKLEQQNVNLLSICKTHED